MAKNIEMNCLNSDGTYEVVYPKTSQAMIENLLSDNTRNLLGLSSTATTDDVFQALYQKNVNTQEDSNGIMKSLMSMVGSLTYDSSIKGISQKWGQPITITFKPTYTGNETTSGTATCQFTVPEGFCISYFEGGQSLYQTSGSYSNDLTIGSSNIFRYYINNELVKTIDASGSSPRNTRECNLGVDGIYAKSGDTVKIVQTIGGSRITTSSSMWSKSSTDLTMVAYGLPTF